MMGVLLVVTVFALVMPLHGVVATKNNLRTEVVENLEMMEKKMDLMDSSIFHNYLTKVPHVMAGKGIPYCEPGDWDWSKDIGKFDYYTFALNYQPAFCESKKETGKCTSSSNFQNAITMHGIWPSYFEAIPLTSLKTNQTCLATGPFQCTDAQIDDNAIQPLLPQMNIDWINIFTDGPADGFWNHEWTKHGTCDGTSQFDYFQKGLNAYGLFNGNVFPLNNLPPPLEEAYYSKGTIGVTEEWLNIYLGGNQGKLSMSCYKNKEGLTFFVGVQLCISRDLKRIDCPSEQNYDPCAGSDGKIYFDTFPDV